MPQHVKPTSCYIRTTSFKLVKVQKFSNMWDTGLTVRDIATHYDIGVHEVYELRKRLGLPSRVSTRYTFEPTTADGYRYVDKDKLVRMYNKGIPIKTIAEEMDIPESSCYHMTRKLGLSRSKLPKGRSQAAIEQENNFRRMYKAGYPYDKIAATLEISKSRCYSLRMELGLAKEVTICSQIGSKESTSSGCCKCITTMSRSR